VIGFLLLILVYILASSSIFFIKLGVVVRFIVTVCIVVMWLRVTVCIVVIVFIVIVYIVVVLFIVIVYIVRYVTIDHNCVEFTFIIFNKLIVIFALNKTTIIVSVINATKTITLIMMCCVISWYY